MQNRIHYFRWTAGLIVVTNSFLTGTKNDKYGKEKDASSQACGGLEANYTLHTFWLNSWSKFRGNGEVYEM